MTVVYGISNCDTVKKARAWLTEHKVAHTFYDFKKQVVPVANLASWASAVGWDKLLNRQGTTWRKLDASAQASAQTSAGATALAMANPSLLKRPVIEWSAGALSELAEHTEPRGVTVGFDEQRWAEIVAK